MPPKGQQQVLFSFHFDHVLTTNITLNGSVLLVIRFFGQYHYSKKKKKRRKHQVLARMWTDENFICCCWECEPTRTLWKRLAASTSVKHVHPRHRPNMCPHVPRDTRKNVCSSINSKKLETTHMSLEVIERIWPASWLLSWTQAVGVSSAPPLTLECRFRTLCPQWEPFQGHSLERGRCCWDHLDRHMNEPS